MGEKIQEVDDEGEAVLYSLIGHSFIHSFGSHGSLLNPDGGIQLFCVLIRNINLDFGRLLDKQRKI